MVDPRTDGATVIYFGATVEVEDEEGARATYRIVGEDEIDRWSKEVRGTRGGQSKIPHVDPTLEGELVQSLARFAGGPEAGIS